ncbi:T9SS type A sorting domain-containing protein [Paraflavitalea pollutisoli]|uniref:T9SS type A sorting domain-containing protein n=1 Tax=Paraflavitalea pollutisoli TaxID=3034143 RepID=UPI0023EC8E7A|nr:T9SS type A sorting domain-containing protein [Paraflavitalea sp. H1-2-19X]
MKLTSIIFICLFIGMAASAQTLTEVYMPRYIQGVGSFNEAAERRVPFACRVKVSGLTPNATYFFYNRFLMEGESSFSQGEGTVIVAADAGFVRIPVPSMSPGEHGEFKADSTGAYTGWFITEPNIANTFAPGINIYFHLLLNDGAGGEYINSFVTSTTPVRVINFGSDSTSGTGLRATPLQKAAAKQFVLLYDNFEATGRPLTATYVESDGTDGSLANGYAPFYASHVNGVNRAFGTIVPNALPNGLRRIDLFELGNGSFKRSYYPYPVIESWNPFRIGFRWPSVSNTLIDTKNPTGGLDQVLVIDGARVLGINLWLSGESFTEEELITLQWNSPAEEEAVEYMVERSEDGKTFSPLRSIPKGENKQVYELKESRSATASFYRIVMTSKDGSRTASDVLKVQGFIKLNVLPNPVADQLLVQHPAAEAGAAIQVIGIDGRRLLTQNVAEGAVQTKVNVNKLIAGNYYVVFSANGQRQSKSFIKK